MSTYDMPPPEVCTEVAEKMRGGWTVARCATRYHLQKSVIAQIRREFKVPIKRPRTSRTQGRTKDAARQEALEPIVAKLGQLSPMEARGLALRAAKALREGVSPQEVL